MEDFIKKYKHVASKKILIRMFQDIMDNFTSQDMFFCQICLLYLGSDMPDGIGCGDCCCFYCSDCAPKSCCGSILINNDISSDSIKSESSNEEDEEDVKRFALKEDRLFDCNVMTNDEYNLLISSCTNDLSLENEENKENKDLIAEIELKTVSRTAEDLIVFNEN